MKILKLSFIAFLLVSSTNCFAQKPSAIEKIKKLSLKPTSPLTWYKDYISVKTLIIGNQNGSEVILGTRSDLGRKVEVGTNLTQRSDVYINNGAAKTVSSGNTTCTTQPKNINDVNTGDFSIFDLGNFDFYPGEFVKPELIINNSGSLTNYNAPQQRRPYKIGLNIFTKLGTKEITVTDFLTKPQAKIQDTLLGRNFGAGIPSKGILEVTEIKSIINLTASLNVSVGLFLPLQELGIPADVTAGLKLDGKNESNINLHYYLVSFTQPLYTLNLLTLPQGLFVNPDDAAANSKGAYVHDVTYGRRAIFIFASTSENQLLDAMFEGGYEISISGGDAAGVEAGIKAEGSLSINVKNSTKKFWGIIYGGNGNSVLNQYNDVNAFNIALKKYINDPTSKVFSNTTNATPLTYTLRSIANGSEIAVRSTGNFEEPLNCSINNYDVDINFEGFKINKVVELWPDDADDIFGTFTLTNFQVGSQNARKINKELFNKDEHSAISKKVGETYLATESPNNIVRNVGKQNLLETTLNFTENIKDWEAARKPEYKPLNDRDLQYSFDDATAAIERLSPGETHTINKKVVLYEDGKSDAAKLTINLKITVKRK